MGSQILYHTVFKNEALKTCRHCKILYPLPPLFQDFPLGGDKMQNHLRWERSGDFVADALPLSFRNKSGIHLGQRGEI